MGIEFNKEQICAIYDIEHWWNSGTSDQVIEVSGAAGTGKTTLIMYFIERIGLKLDEVLFVAYMGKAANQMALNGLPAKTIHSAIYPGIFLILQREGAQDPTFLFPPADPSPYAQTERPLKIRFRLDCCTFWRSPVWRPRLRPP